ncbi:hypothetical protein AK830_g5807 [Neonectria ditissima]|uniref:chitinase n=1 Tax=Neonectria ditissima TaxID=78410 RepID=A0A0P7BKC6_9HYPO|nr:hypothetical protein AK830_g5807 [Neonectria ditissima]
MGSRSVCPSLFRVLFVLISFVSFSAAAEVATTDPEDAVSNPLTTEGCPQLCQDVGSDPSKWTQLHSWGELTGCSQPVLFGLNIENPPSEFATMQTCAKPAGSTTKTRLDEASPVEARAAEGSVLIENNCGAEKATVKLSNSIGPAGVLKGGNDVAVGARALAQYLSDGASCGPTILFAKSGSSVVGIYVGAEVQKASASSLITASSSYFQPSPTPDRQETLSTLSHIPYIPFDKRTQTVGIFAVGAVKDLPQAQKAVKAWANGGCVAVSGQTSSEDVDLGVLVAPKVQKRDVELRSKIYSHHGHLIARADCKTTQVVSGDSCASLAKRCGVTTANFNKYNPAANFCSKLVVNQYVCCSAGTLPDRRPQPQKDGTCAIYAIKSGDSCYSMAQAYGLTENFIRDVNKLTWGWAGCYRLDLGQRICLSKGKTPMPKAITGAVCGPQVPGTGKPTTAKNGWDVVNLNPCPLKACCSGFGFCGITGEFCTNTTAVGGAPGTYKAGTAGCIQNCGNKITGNTAKPAKFLSVGYFQGYNLGRPCLTMDVTNLTLAKDTYTHMHFAFASLTTGFSVTLGDQGAQFKKFAAMTAPWKKILSFGGWADSTDAATFQRYRDAVKAANREKFATNVVTFLNKYKLDGVDFDWEYPGSTAAAGSSDSGEDATNYLAFLTLMRKKLGTGGKTMSAALPAAYWYLKPFPVDKMAPQLDYLVYMTYDLHGQWDYGNQYASPACPSGNCLRSHVNKTETIDALAMITKAGVPASKVVVGVSSYGRSFRMQDPKCTGPQCTFTGSFSTSLAEPGLCTGSAGYLANAEINKIIADAKAGKTGVSATTWYDKTSDSDIMTFGTQGNGQTDWVAYMSDSTKKSRKTWAQGLNFGGTIDWAVDLQVFFDNTK